MATAIEVISEQEFVSELDEKEDNPTRWKIKRLDGVQYIEVCRAGAVDYNLAIMYGLVGWENFNDFDGNPVKYSAANIKRIPPLYLQDIGFEIMLKSELKGDARKNS